MKKELKNLKLLLSFKYKEHEVGTFVNKKGTKTVLWGIIEKKQKGLKLI